MQVISREPERNRANEQFMQNLTNVLQHKIGKIQQRQEATKISSYLQSQGADKDKAEAFAALPMDLQKHLFSTGGLDKMLSTSVNNQQSNQQPSVQQALQQPQVEQQQQQQTQQQQPQVSGMRQDFSRQSTLKRVLAGGFGPEQMRQFANPGQQNNYPWNQQQAAQPQPQQQQQVQQQPQPQVKQPSALASLVDIPKSGPLSTAKERADYTKAVTAARKEAKVEQHYIDQRLDPYIKEIDKKGGIGARATDFALNKLEKLIDTGKLTGPAMYNFRKKLEEHGGAIGAGFGTAAGTIGGAVLGSTMPGVGTVGGALAGATLGGGVGKGVGELIGQKFIGSTEDQEFIKTALGSFLPRMKDLFGSRVAIQEMTVFMDSIPSLSQTDEGKKAIIKSMRLTNDANKYIKQTKDNIIEANGGIIPSDLEARVEKATDPYLNKLAQDFASSIPKELMQSVA